MCRSIKIEFPKKKFESKFIKAFIYFLLAMMNIWSLLFENSGTLK
jgi:hypothetical protein